MSTRRTTRSAAQQGPTIADHFQQSRVGGSVLPGKSLGDDVPSTTSRAKRVLFSSSWVEVPIIEVQQEKLPVHDEKLKAKSCPIPVMFSTVPKKTARTEIKEETTKEEVKEKIIEPAVKSMIPTEEETAEIKPNATKARSVIDLQAELGRNGAAQVHKQKTERTLKQIDEHVALLKSPTKMVQTRLTGGSPPKRAKKESKKRGAVKVLPVPDYVLPSKSVEKPKERPERERSEDRETSPQEDSIARAPKNYGSTLMNEEVKRSRTVQLPINYKELHDAFSACDQIVSIFHSKGQTITFSSLSQAVKKLSRKEFTLERFSQLLAVYPHAYHVQVKKITCVGDRMGGARSGRYEHVITPNLDDDLTAFVTDPSQLEEIPAEPILTSSPRKNLFSPMKGRPITSSTGIRIPSSPRKSSSPVKQMQREVVMDSRKRLIGWRVSCRQQVFRCLLARRVLTAYDAFLHKSNLSPSAPSPFLPITFNREFVAKIDSLCLPVERAMIDEIPEEDNIAGTSHQGMGDFVKIASTTVTTLPKGVEAALLDLRSPEKSISSRGIPLSPIKFAKEAPKPMSLIERIRAREAEKAAAELKRDPVLEAKLADLTRLVDDKILHLIFNIYRAASRTSINVKEMAQSIADSKQISQDKVLPLFDRLSSLVSSSFSIGQTNLGRFLKVKDNSTSAYEIVASALKKELDACRMLSTN